MEKNGSLKNTERGGGMSNIPKINVASEYKDPYSSWGMLQRHTVARVELEDDGSFTAVIPHDFNQVSQKTLDELQECKLSLAALVNERNELLKLVGSLYAENASR